MSKASKLLKSMKEFKATLYHGSGHKFTEFDPEKVGSTTDPGFYAAGLSLTPNKGLASAYASGAAEKHNSSPHIYNADVHLKNPLYIHGSQSNPNTTPSDGWHSKISSLGIDNTLKPKELTKELISRGHDGIVRYDHTGKLKEVTAFHSHTVKLNE